MTAAPGTPTIVLTGHGMVGQRFLEALADHGVTDRARVVVLCEEPRPAYDRVRLTSYFSGTTLDELSLTDGDFMTRHGIELCVGEPAVAVDRTARTVATRNGRTFAYDTLVLATGSYPFVPPVPGKDSAGCFVYRTVEDLLAIESYARTARTGVVVGGGLLGLEAAGALRGLGLDTHVVEFSPRLMALCAGLEALMAAHVAGYRDEWAETLADPERLRRFVSFVNAPGAPDPSVRFVEEREQIKPDLTVLSGPDLPVRTLEGTSAR